MLSIWPVVYLFRKAKSLPYVWKDSPQSPRDNNSDSSIKEWMDDSKILAELLQESSRTSIKFISIDVHACNSEPSRITDIGVSLWETGMADDSQGLSYHWQIKDNLQLSNQYALDDPNAYAFGSTKFISETEIETMLNELFKAIMARCQKILLLDMESTSR